MLNRPYSPLLLCAALALPLLSMPGVQSAARAQGFPTKPVKVILPSPPGGGTDALARILADKLREKWGQPVIVENRAGAGGNIAGDVTSKAVPDGYTLMLAHPAPLVINKALYSKLSYDPDQFVPVSLVATVPNVLVVNAASPAASVAQLIAMARAAPGKLNFASGAVGSPSSLTPELFKSMTGVNIPSIPFQGSAPALVALLGGQVDMLFVELSTALPHIRAGKLRALAVAAERRSPFLPEVPTLADTLPGFNASVWFGIVAPPKTPAALAEQISRAVADALKLADVSKQLLDMSMEAVGGTPAEMAQYLREESRRWGAVIRQSGARAD
jgi:tripartite-type tricarboxylate transporter receptor subunit TctC